MIDEALIVARLIHILGGVFWVGAMVFVTEFLVPSIGEAGPDGAKVMAGIARRKFMQIMPVVAALTILSGIYLYSRVSAGFEVGYMKSWPGHVYAIAGGMSVIAFILGVTITRPAMIKAVALAQAASTAAAGERESLLGQAQALRSRGSKVGRVVVLLLVASTVGMAIGRYL